MNCIKQLTMFGKLLLFIVVHFTQALDSTLLCDSLCFKGQFCKGEDCLPCPNGTFMSQDSHHLTFCQRWTSKPGHNVIIVTPGSDRQDIVWGCETGYIKRYFNSAGDWDCVKAQTTITTTAPTTTSLPVTTTVKQTTLIVAVGSSRELETKYIVVIAVFGIIFLIVIIVGTAVVIKCRRSRNNIRFDNVQYHSPPSQLNKSLRDLFSVVERKIGSEEISKLIDHLNDPNGKVNKQQNPKDVLESWASEYPEINHAQEIKNILSNDIIGISFSISSDVISTVTVREGLLKAIELNRHFKNFCGKMVTKLGLDAVNLATLLSLATELENKRASEKTFELAFSACMAKWAFQFVYVYTESERTWEPLTVIKEKLIEMGRNDIVDDLPELTEDVIKAMKNYSNLQNHENGATICV